MSNFMESVKDTMLDGANNISVTENGAVGYRTTGRSLLDLNFAVASLRNASVKEIADRFTQAFFEDKVTMCVAGWVSADCFVRLWCRWQRSFRSTLHRCCRWCLSMGVGTISGVCWIRRWAIR